MTTATDLCATVGCNHRRDEHTRVREDGIDWNVCTGDDDCLDFTDPLLLDHDYSLADEIRVGRAEPTVAEHYHDSDSVEGWRRGVKRRCTENHAPTVAEHDDNLDLEAIRARAEAASEGPWFYNGYSAVFTRDLPDPSDGLTFDEWADTIGEGHSAERYGACPACETDRPSGCKFAGEWTRRENHIAGVPAAYGDTATGLHAEDAEFIAHARTDIPALLAALDAERAKNTEAKYGECADCGGPYERH